MFGPTFLSLVVVEGWTRCSLLFRYDTGHGPLFLCEPLAVTEAPEIAKHLQEFIVFKEVIRICGLPEPGLVHDEGFVHHHTADPESLLYLRNKGAL